MIMEYLENTVQLLFILISLLVSLFRYIGSKKRGWLYSVVFFTSSLLSSYFWTAYLVIMGDTPNASDTLTYFGWNVSYFVLVLLTFHEKSKEERRYFHPLMLLPIPLNIWQLSLYLKFGGALNSSYQVGICTVIAVMCIQSLMWYLKNRRDSARFPYISVAVLVYIISEFGMWTASCYDGWASYVYYLFSFLCSASYFFLLWAIKRVYSAEGGETEYFIDRRVQSYLQGFYITVVMVCSLGGIFLGSWIRNVLTRGVYDTAETDVYSIISVILFLISIILAAVAITITLIAYFEQRISENNRLREEKQVAERANLAKSEFLANMSHEIRTPLNAVLGMNRMIVLESSGAQDSLPDDKELVRRMFSDITEYAGNIESAGNNLLSIINDILDLSKIEAGKLDIIEQNYKLSSVLNDVSNIILFRAKDKGLDYNADIDENIPDCLCGDDLRLRQIIGNVLNNAVKYTDSGSVTLSVRGEGSYLAGESTVLTITVKDTGIGIRKEELEKIFDKFERTDLERNGTVEGTGLGLSITHHLLDMMGGSIHVESEYGSGSVFTIKLPQKVVSAEPIGNFREKFEKSVNGTQAAEHLFSAPDARILIVDDTRMNIAVAVGLIKDTGIQTDTAESGAAALKLCSDNRYDLILLDQRMPVMDGTETLRRIRNQANGVSSEVPVICLTADALTGAKERYISEGFDDYLSKPIDSRAFKQMLMKYLPSEKILPVSDDKQSPEKDDLSTADIADIYGSLRRAGIDTESGLGYCQKDDELYMILLQEFVQGAEERINSLCRYYGEHDAKNYAILVHSLKSSSKTIGAGELSDVAARLEKAADKDSWDYVTENHSGMLDRYRELVAAVADAVGKELLDTLSDSTDQDEIMEFFPE